MLIPRQNGREHKEEENENGTHREVLREALDAFAFAGLFAVELLRVELLVQAQRFDLAVQAGKVGLCWGGEVEPRRARCLVLHLL